jgi:tetratricopeptide (TPR) repeat protein
MKEISLGEGRKFFPSFFLIFCLLFLCLTIDSSFFSLIPAAQASEKKELSRFDQLAEEATLLNKRGQSDKVIALLEPYKGDPKNDSALFFNELGIAYRRKGKLVESIQVYQAALLHAPQNPVIMNNLGLSLYMNKEYPQAIEQYQKALQLAPRFKEAHSNLGLAYYQTQQYREAKEEFEIVLQLNPKDEDAQKFYEEILKKIKGQK